MDPDLNELPEIELNNQDNMDYLKKLFVDFADEFHRRYQESNNLIKANDA